MSQPLVTPLDIHNQELAPLAKPAYRVIAQADGGESVLNVTTSTIADWIAGKGYGYHDLRQQLGKLVKADLGGEFAESKFRGFSYQDDHGRQVYRWGIQEAWQKPIWTLQTTGTGETRVTVVFEPSNGSTKFWIEIVPPTLLVSGRREGTPKRVLQYVGSPRFLGDLFARADFYDGGVALFEEVTHVSSQRHVQELFDAIVSRERVGTVYVAAPLPGESGQQLAGRLAENVPRIPGMATAYALDASVVEEFNRLAMTHDVKPGEIRTFFSSPDIGSRADQFRHRVVSRDRFTHSQDDALKKALRNRLLRELEAAPLPPSVRLLENEVRRRAHQAVIDTLASGGAAEPEPRKLPAAEIRPSAVLDDVLSPRPVPRPPASGAPRPIDAPKPSEADKIISHEEWVESPEANASNGVVAPSQEVASSQTEPMPSVGSDGPDSLTGSERSSAVSTPVVDPETFANAVAEVLASKHVQLFDIESAISNMRDALKSESEEVDLLNDRINDLESALQDYEKSLVATQDELDATLGNYQALTSEAGRLNWELAQAKQHLPADWQSGYVGAGQVQIFDIGSDEFEEIDSFAELIDFAVDRMSDSIELVLEDEFVLELDEIVHVNSPLTKAKRAFVTFDTFVRVRNAGLFEGTLIDYVQNAQHSYYVGITDFSPEGETVKSNRSFAQQRTRPVPNVVSANGEHTFNWHVKLGSVPGSYPRLYFEDWYGRLGKVGIGYLGKHLANTLTN